MTLNPVKPAGREVVKKLVAVSDVVIANLPYEDIKKMGIDYDTIAAINPRIILATNSTFGSEGPYATRVGFDTIGQAMSGAMHLSGDGTVPTRANAPYVDFGSALLSTVGVMAAVLLQVLDTTIANVALPHMQASLSATQDTINWVLTSYIVASAIALPISGWLADRVGRKRLLLTSVVCFTAS